MNALRRRLDTFCFIALMAMLAMALLPTVSHALAFAQGTQSNWAEVCTPQGMKLVVLDDAGPGEPAPASAASHLEHCPFCAQGSSVLGLPPTVVPALVLPLAADTTPPLFLKAPRTLFAWAAAQPRGPPHLS